MAALTPDTKTTLAVTALCVTAFLGGALWIERSLNTVSTRLGLVEYRLEAIEHGSDDRWRRADMRAWVRDFKERNPSISVPTVD